MCKIFVLTNMNKIKKEGQCYFTLESKIGGVVEEGIVVNGWFYSERWRKIVKIIVCY